MDFILWLVGISEVLFILYFVARYLSVLIQERKCVSEEENACREVRRLAG